MVWEGIGLCYIYIGHISCLLYSFHLVEVLLLLYMCIMCVLECISAPIHVSCMQA